MSAQPTIAIQTTSTDKEIAQPTTANTTIHTTSTYDEIGRFDVLCGRDKKWYDSYVWIVLSSTHFCGRMLYIFTFVFTTHLLTYFYLVSFSVTTISEIDGLG
jgi:hypothetical protein